MPVARHCLHRELVPQPNMSAERELIERIAMVNGDPLCVRGPLVCVVDRKHAKQTVAMAQVLAGNVVGDDRRRGAAAVCRDGGNEPGQRNLIAHQIAPVVRATCDGQPIPELAHEAYGKARSPA